MKQTFWLLDLNHETYEGKSSIWLWGITHEGKRVLVIDNYRAYFYLLPRKKEDPEELRKKLEAEKPHPTIENATIEKKKLLADERVVLKAFCKDPALPERAARETLKKTGAEATYEEKLRLAIKYQYDHGSKPCQWYEADTAVSTIEPNETNTPLRVGRDEGPPHQSLYGHYSLIGRANVDLLNFAEDLYEVKNKTVENVAKYLGIQSPNQKPIDETANFDYWSKPDQRKILVKHMEEQTETILAIGEEAIDYVIQISALSGLPPDQVIAAAVGFRVDNY